MRCERGKDEEIGTLEAPFHQCNSVEMLELGGLVDFIDLVRALGPSASNLQPPAVRQLHDKNLVHFCTSVPGGPSNSLLMLAVGYPKSRGNYGVVCLTADGRKKETITSLSIMECS
mmetsp:Transcript_34145/g.88147  ORF Transcript_34145/g.88147 Transcript_34145/m.88147 type:complete len:116 (+) Transcript_34145:445-792(+)